MNDNDIKLKLLAGLPIDIEGLGEFQFPTVRDIIKMNESRYNNLISSLLIDKSIIEKDLNEDVSDFDFLFIYCYHDENFREIVLDALELLVKERPLINSVGNYPFFEFKNDKKWDKDNHALLQKVIKIAHFIKTTKTEEEFKPANSKAREMIEEMLKSKKSKPKRKEETNLCSIISGLSWNRNGINAINIFDLTFYQIYNGFLTTENIDNYHHTLSGIFAGTVDREKIKMSEIHWAKIIENK